MKKVLLILGIIILSFNSYAVEHYISFGGGIRNINTEIQHRIYYSQKNLDTNTTSLENFYEYQRDNLGKSLLNMEYGIILADHLILGVGYNYSKNILLNDTFNNTKHHLNSNNLYLLTMIRLFHNNLINVNVGFEHTVKNPLDNYNIITNIDYKVSSSIYIYSKLAYNLSKYTITKELSTNRGNFDNYINSNSNLELIELIENIVTVRNKSKANISFGLKYNL